MKFNFLRRAPPAVPESAISIDQLRAALGELKFFTEPINIDYKYSTNYVYPATPLERLVWLARAVQRAMIETNNGWAIIPYVDSRQLSHALNDNDFRKGEGYAAGESYEQQRVKKLEAAIVLIDGLILKDGPWKTRNVYIAKKRAANKAAIERHKRKLKQLHEMDVFDKKEYSFVEEVLDFAGRGGHTPSTVDWTDFLQEQLNSFFIQKIMERAEDLQSRASAQVDWKTNRKDYDRIRNVNLRSSREIGHNVLSPQLSQRTLARYELA